MDELKLNDEGGGANNLPGVNVFEHSHVVCAGAALHGIKSLWGKTYSALLLSFVLLKESQNFSKKGQMKGYFSSNKDILLPFCKF